MAAAAGMNLQNPDPLQQEIDNYNLVINQAPRAPAGAAEDAEWHIEPLCEFNSTISRVALGALAWVVELPIVVFVTDRVVSFMESRGIEFTAKQDVVAIYNSLNSITLKVALLAYAVILGPILEEYLFRHMLQGATRWIQGSDDLIARVIRVLVNALIFAAMHLSSAQGYTNIPIFAATFILGCVFATVREVSGDIVASSTTHILHNGTAMAQLLLRA
jgi:membrane protease YdiL (CAAX protease family)